MRRCGRVRTSIGPQDKSRAGIVLQVFQELPELSPLPLGGPFPRPRDDRTESKYEYNLTSRRESTPSGAESQEQIMRKCRATSARWPHGQSPAYKPRSSCLPCAFRRSELLHLTTV